MRTISIRLDDKECEELDDVLRQMGQTKQTFFETYTKTVLRLRRIPFVIEAPKDPFYSKSNMDQLERSEQQLKDALGTKVSIVSGKKGRGKIEIEYYSDAELERLLSLLSDVQEGEVS